MRKWLKNFRKNWAAFKLTTGGNRYIVLNISDDGKKLQTMTSGLSETEILDIYRDARELLYKKREQKRNKIFKA